MSIYENETMSIYASVSVLYCYKKESKIKKRSEVILLVMNNENNINTEY